MCRLAAGKSYGDLVGLSTVYEVSHLVYLHLFPLYWDVLNLT